MHNDVEIRGVPTTQYHTEQYELLCTEGHARVVKQESREIAGLTKVYFRSSCRKGGNLNNRSYDDVVLRDCVDRAVTKTVVGPAIGAGSRRDLARSWISCILAIRWA